VRDRRWELERVPTFFYALKWTSQAQKQTDLQIYLAISPVYLHGGGAGAQEELLIAAN